MSRKINSQTEERVKKLNSQLRKAIRDKDAKQINELYDQYDEFDLEQISDKTFNEYDKLVDQGNEVIYQ